MPVSDQSQPELALSPRMSHAHQMAAASDLRQQGAQPGIAFPSASEQTNLLLVRLNLAPARLTPESVSRGLRRLCRLFADLDNGKKKIDVLNDQTGRPEQANLREAFHLSATVGIGQGFFDLLHIPAEKRPRRLKAMPDHVGLGDVTPYSLGQTDMILQLGSSSAFVNRWVLENTLQPQEGDGGDGAGGADEPTPPDIVTAVSGWATIEDVHAGFQRTDGRNLQGFNDGVSNPRAGSDQFDAVVWSSDETNPALNGGTYMVFQKIIHDLDQWRELDVDEQQEWVGRSKGTGLLLGTLDEDEDAELARGLRTGSDDAFKKWKRLFDLQSHPEIPFFSPDLVKDPLPEDVVKAGFTAKEVQDMARRIADRCPAWSHVRKVNPRGADGIDFRILFRRGYPFMETSLDNKLRSGLLFVSFQNDIEARFEFIKRQWAGNKSFPVPALRPFTEAERRTRHRMGRFSADELGQIAGDADKRKLLGLEADDDFQDALKQAREDPLTQLTGREGLAGPSELGTVPTGEFLAIMPLGGGYYFVPPVPNNDLSQIGQQLFEAPAAGPPATRTAAIAYRGAMNVFVAPGSPAERSCRTKAGAGLAREEAVAPAAAAAVAGRGRLVPGLPSTPDHNLIFRGGRTLPHLIYVNVYVAGPDAWAAGDMDNIDANLAAAFKDRRLEGVIAQYFPGQAISATFRGPRQLLPGPAPGVFTRGNVTEAVRALAQAVALSDFDLSTTVFNFLLPRGTILTTDAAPATAQTRTPTPGRPRADDADSSRPAPVADVDDLENSLQGLGGYHGSVRFGSRRVYFAVGVFSDQLDGGTTNGIVAFGQPWKNVVATFYHELCEARTDPDVEEANRTGNVGLVGWTSAQGEEVGDFPVFEAPDLTRVFKEVPRADGNGTVPVQLQYSNRVNGPEDPTLPAS